LQKTIGISLKSNWFLMQFCKNKSIDDECF